jgi:hypothetical protein
MKLLHMSIATLLLAASQLGCISHHTKVTCRSTLYLTTSNGSADTIQLQFKRNDNGSSQIQSISEAKRSLLPAQVSVDTIGYEWTGADGCFLDCTDKDYNGQWFYLEISTNQSTLLHRDTIVPCVPCDSARNDLNTICVDCPNAVYYTINYR